MDRDQLKALAKRIRRRTNVLVFAVGWSARWYGIGHGDTTILALAGWIAAWMWKRRKQRKEREQKQMYLNRNWEIAWRLWRWWLSIKRASWRPTTTSASNIKARLATRLDGALYNLRRALECRALHPL